MGEDGELKTIREVDAFVGAVFEGEGDELTELKEGGGEEDESVGEGGGLGKVRREGDSEGSGE